MLGLIMGIVLISLVSAVSYDLIAGEPYTFNLNESYEYYSIVGNSTPIDLNITQEGTIVTILTNKYFPTSSFEIVFFNSEKQIITEYVSSGGGSSIKYVDKEVIVEVPNYIDKEVEVIREIECKEEEEKIGFFKKILNWIRNLFGGKDK